MLAVVACRPSPAPRPSAAPTTRRSTTIANSSPRPTARPSRSSSTAIPSPACRSDDVAQRLLPMMQAAKPRPDLTFTYDNPAEMPRPYYRLVLVFDPANDLGADAVCNGVTPRFKPGTPGVFKRLCRLLPQRHDDVADDGLDAGDRPGRSAHRASCSANCSWSCSAIRWRCARRTASTAARSQALHRDSLLTRRHGRLVFRSPTRSCRASTPRPRMAWRSAP